MLTSSPYSRMLKHPEMLPGIVNTQLKTGKGKERRVEEEKQRKG